MLETKHRVTEYLIISEIAGNLSFFKYTILNKPLVRGTHVKILWRGGGVLAT